MKRKVRILKWSCPLWPILASLAVVGIVLAAFLYALVRQPATFTRAGISLTPISGWPVNWGMLLPDEETLSPPITFQLDSDVEANVWIEFSDPNGLCPDATGDFTLNVYPSNYPDETTMDFGLGYVDLCEMVPGAPLAQLMSLFMDSYRPHLDDGQFTLWLSLTSHNIEGGHLESSFDVGVIATELGQTPDACTATTDTFPSCDVEE